MVALASFMWSIGGVFMADWEGSSRCDFVENIRIEDTYTMCSPNIVVQP